MVFPNLANLNTILSFTKSVNVTTSLSNVITNLPLSNSLVIVNGLIVSNETAATTTNVNILLNNRGTQTSIANKLLMPPGNVFALLSKTNEFSIVENSSLQANAEGNNLVKITVSYNIVSENTDSSSVFPMEYLVVAGGGGGGASNGGGGGAGGFRTGTLTGVTTGGCYTITVGAGGAGTTNEGNGNKGVDSAFATITATGGGYGAGGSGGAQGGPGGSGGGGTTQGGPGGPGNTPATTPSQGNNGAAGSPNFGQGGGGGGGAGGAGAAGAGGAGLTSTISGSSVTYAGGGGGTSSPNTGGSGGGGNSGVNGTTNSGGGGGGWTGTTVGNGGSGIVILRHPTDRPIASNTTGNVTITSNGGFTIYQFTSSGSITF